MALVLNGSGTITGLTSGGLPDGSITSDDLASSVTTGKVLQVVKNIHTSTSQLTSSGSMHELTSSLRLSITPESATSTLYFKFYAGFVSPNSGNLHYAKFYNYTDSSDVNIPPASGSRERVHWTTRVTPADANDMFQLAMATAESSGSTSARTYTIYHSTEGVTAQFLVSTLSSSAGTVMPAFFKITEVEA